MAKGPTTFSQLLTLLDVAEKARPYILSQPQRAVSYVAAVVVDLYGPELAKLTPAEWDNLEIFAGESLDAIRRRIRPPAGPG